MNGRIIIIAMLSFLGACSREISRTPVESEYKEALLRTVQSYGASKNIDKNNPLEVMFMNDFQGQLIELSFVSSNMNNSFYTVANSDALLKSKKSQVALGDLKVELNGVDITDCLIEGCNDTKCGGQVSEYEGFSGNLNLRKINLNLTKLNCTSLAPDQLNRLTFRELSSTGAHINAQVLVYNRTYKLEDIENVFSL